MAAIVANTGSNNWNTNGAWVGGVQPGAGDDVTIPATAVVTIPTATTVLGRSCTISASGTLAFAATTSVLTLGDGTAGAGNVAFSNAGTITLTGIGTINFVSTSATQQTITTGGQTLPNYTINGAGSSYLLSDTNTSSGTVTLTTGTLNTNGQTCSWAALVATAGVLTLGASSITASGAATPWNVGGSVTVNAGTSNITVTVASGGSTGWGGKTFNNVVLNTSGLPTFQVFSGQTFANLTVNGNNTKTCVWSIANNVTNMTVTGTLTLNSNSLVNRLLVQSSTVGTTRTITAGSLVCTNVVDFMDITGAGAATWTTGASGATAFGDCQGNSGITFTTPVTRYGVVAGNGSSTATWSTSSGGAGGASVPLPQDTMILDANSAAGTYTMDMPRLGVSLTCTGFTRTLALSVATILFGSLTLANGMTLTSAGAMTTFQGRGSGLTITSAGNSFLNGSLTFAGPGGTYTLQDALVTTNRLTVTSNCTLTGNGFNVTVGSGAVIGLVTTAPAMINGGTGVWTILSTSGTPLSIAASTLSFASTPVTIGSASTSSRTFAGAGHTFGTLTYTIANSPGPLVISNNGGTIGTLNIGPGRVLTMLSSTTNTLTTFNATGVNNGFEYLPGLNGNYVSTPSSTPLNITGDITIDAKIGMPGTWASQNWALVSKYTGVASTTAYLFILGVSGNLTLYMSDGSTITSINSGGTSLTTVFGSGTTGWVRVTRQQSSGTTQFYTSTDGISWTLFNNSGAFNAGTAITTNVTELELGTNTGGTFNPGTGGRYYEARIYNGYQGAGTLVFDANFTTKAFGANTFTESSSNAATVTINGAVAQAGDGRVLLNSSTPGATATMHSTAQQSVDYLTIQDSTVDTSPRWYAGANSVNTNSTAVHWIFTAPVPFGSPNLLLMGVG